MSEKKQFNPIKTARTVEDLYREYIATTIHFADADLQSQLETILGKRRFLAKGPFLEAAPPYRQASSVRQLVDEGVLCESMLKLGGFDADRPLYVHQERAIRKAVSGRNYAVVTGTGSGKTESFLLPIVNDILAEFEEKGPSSGVRAMILYPMNALANDQLKRLRQLLAGTDITFGRYTGDTETSPEKAIKKWKSENPGQEKLRNEIISRKAIRENPPNILLTNYSMLEYLLLRPDDASLFGSVFGANWRHIAIDEAHIYTGALGTEIAYLIRRLKARIASEVGSMPKLHCYATSATIGSDEDVPNVAKFAQGLFGEPFSSDPSDLDVVTSEKDSPVSALDDSPWGTLPLQVWKQLRECIGCNPDETKSLLADVLKSAIPSEKLQILADSESPLLGLGKILLGEASAMALVRTMSEALLDLTDIDEMKSIGIKGMNGSDDDIEVLSSMVEVLSWAQRSEDVPILTSRYHSFLRAPEGIFLNLRDRKLIEHKMTVERSPEGYEVPVYETSVCRHCGQAYVLGQETSISDANPNPWLNPKHQGTNADDEFIPRDYYRLIPQGEEADPDETVQWLCPTCGSIGMEKDDIGHRFEHEACERIPIAYNSASEDDARCNHCGYTSRVAIQPMRVSPEAAGSVVCYDLVRDIPSFKAGSEPKQKGRFAKVEKKHGGNVICFSDKRQDAAFFAPAMKRTYRNITIRQLIREAVEAKSPSGEGCSPTQVCKWIAETGSKRYSGFMDAGAKEDQALAWVIDELTAEDSRNSLEGLGVVRVEPTSFVDDFKDEDVAEVLKEDVSDLSGEFPWLTVFDYRLFLVMSLETLRERGAIEVPVGIDAYRTNRLVRANDVVYGGEGAGKSDIKFVGSASATVDNKRAAFIRKYARRVYGIEVSREQARTILKKLFDFLTEYLSLHFEAEGYMVGNVERFQLNKDIWKMYPHKDSDVVFRCDTCGCESHLDTNGVCTTNKCEGHLERMTFAEAKEKDRFYKEIYCEEALPIEIEEHTAQLSSERARLVQSRFIEGDVNVLSCTTTFELGVDVGDLRAIFMRNVPPSTANYTQRAGRVGRRAGMPGYALTFCRLRPHDIAHFNDPRRIIAGDTRVPCCYMENTAIAIRHIFAVAMSEFFRHMRDDEGQDYSLIYDDFMSLKDDEPRGLKQLSSFLEDHPEAISRQLEVIFPSGGSVSESLGVNDWSWIGKLVSAESGQLTRTHGIKRSDFLRIEDALGKSTDSFERSKLEKSKGALEKEKTISVLAENGILPKYGFPTDLVELHLGELDHRKEEERLKIQRGLRQAISEYAPGSEIVAGGELWRSTGIRKKKEPELITRSFGKCECGAFVWPIDNLEPVGKCPVCHKTVQLRKKMLIPSFGFEGKRVKKGIGLRKPRSTGYSRVYFSQHSINEVSPSSYSFPGGTVEARFSGNGQLCAVNSNGKAGFQICTYCGAAAGFKEDVVHAPYCEKGNPVPSYNHIDALGAAFVSDVIELVLDIDGAPAADEYGWESVMWAIFTAAAKLLNIPQAELGGTLYENDRGTMSLLIYDDVPGGAGHARQLSEMVEKLIQAAYDVVGGHCGCGEETCCYGCIANYYNQSKQADLSRGAAKQILGTLLSSQGGQTEASAKDERPSDVEEKPLDAIESRGIEVCPEFTNVDYSSTGMQRICEDAQAGSEDGQRLLYDLAEIGDDEFEELPEPNVVFGFLDDEFVALLAWKSRRVAVIEQSEYDHILEATGRKSAEISGWTLVLAEQTASNELIELLKEV